MNKFEEFYKNKNYLKIKNYSFNYLNRKSFIKSFFKKIKIKDCDIVMDIGSGTSPVSPIPEKTIFFDISNESLEYLKNRGYKTLYGDIEKIPFKSNSVTIVLCSEVLEHVKDYKKSLKEMFRILKNNGTLILTVPVYKKYWGFDDEFVGHLRRFEPKTLIEEIKKTGFKIIKEKPIGSKIERNLTKLIVKIYKTKSNLKVSKTKLSFIKIINYILYIIVKFSIIFSSKKNTSIILYYCKK